MVCLLWQNRLIMSLQQLEKYINVLLLLRWITAGSDIKTTGKNLRVSWIDLVFSIWISCRLAIYFEWNSIKLHHAFICWNQPISPNDGKVGRDHKEIAESSRMLFMSGNRMSAHGQVNCTSILANREFRKESGITYPNFNGAYYATSEWLNSLMPYFTMIHAN